MNNISHAHTRKLATLGMCAAISIVLIYFIHFPIFPMISFMEYDPGDIPIFLCSYIFGPISGLVITVIASLIQGLTVSSSSGVIGIVMHILATGSYVIVSGLLMRKTKKIKRLLISATIGCLTMTFTMGLWNLLFTPFYMHIDVNQILPLMPYIILFNLIKAGLNTVIAVFLYKMLQKLLPKQYLC